MRGENNTAAASARLGTSGVVRQGLFGFWATSFVSAGAALFSFSEDEQIFPSLAAAASASFK